MASTGVKIDEFWKKIWAQNGLRIILVCDLGISVIISIVRGPSFKVLQTAVKLLDAARWKHHILLSKLNKKWNLTYYLLLLIIYGYITITIRYIWHGPCFFSGLSDTFRPSNLPIMNGLYDEVIRWHSWLQLFARNYWFSLFLTKASPTDQPTDGPADGQTDGRTDPAIEMRGRI